MQSGYYKIANDSEQRWQTKHIVALCLCPISELSRPVVPDACGGTSELFLLFPWIHPVHNTVAQILSNDTIKV